MGQGDEPRPFRPHLISTSRSAARRPAWTPVRSPRPTGRPEGHCSDDPGGQAFLSTRGEDVARTLKSNRPVTQPRHQSACGGSRPGRAYANRTFYSPRLRPSYRQRAELSRQCGGSPPRRQNRAPSAFSLLASGRVEAGPAVTSSCRPERGLPPHCRRTADPLRARRRRDRLRPLDADRRARASRDPARASRDRPRRVRRRRPTRSATRPPAAALHRPHGLASTHANVVRPHTRAAPLQRRAQAPRLGRDNRAGAQDQASRS